MNAFDPGAAFTSTFDGELAEQPDAVWQVSGKATKEWPNAEDESWWRANGPRMVERWMEWRTKYTWDPWVTPDGELAIELAIEEPVLGEPLKHYIDTVFATAPDNDRPVIVDIKSGAKPPDSPLQLGVYKVVIENRYPGVKIAGGAFWFARSGELGPIINLDKYTPQLIARYAREVRMARGARVFLPRISSFCRTCKVGRFCAINGGAESHFDPDYQLMGG